MTKIEWMLGDHSVAAPYFSGHESFTLRFTWLPKAVRTSKEHRDIFNSEDAMVQLGVGKNMVRSIRHWGHATGVLDEVAANKAGRLMRPVPSRLGELIFGEEGVDPYLEDPGTLWLLHWQLASRPSGPTTWYWAFNQFADSEFTKDKLELALRDYIDRQGWKRIADATVGRDIDCFLRTYLPKRRGRNDVIEDSLDCPLTELGLIQEAGAGLYCFNRGEHFTLPIAVFIFALTQYWELNAPLLNTLSFDQVAYHSGSPGRVFKLSDSALITYLEQLSDITHGAIGFGATAGLRQLYLHKPLNFEFSASALKRYFVDGKGR